MAASPPAGASVGEKNEINESTEEREDVLDSGLKDELAKKESIQTEEEFKKPAVFAVPSLSAKRSNAAPSSETSTHQPPAEEKNIDTSSATPCESKILEKHLKEEENGGEAPVNANPEAKPKVRSCKGPPVGKFPPVPYTEPEWGETPPDSSYDLEILKNGTIVDKLPLSDRGYFLVGRLPVCDVTLEHPSISRYHAVIQYRGGVGEERGFYVHDLASTHGTVVNKNKIPPKTYIRLHVGHVLKFGGSTRLFILQGPEFDEEKESELTVTELRERARKQKEELEKRMMGDFSEEEEQCEERKETIKSKASKDDQGCTWGMDEDAAPEDENEENPFSTEFHEDQEAAYLKDPKKALQGFYDREGEELEFEYEDKNHGSWLCRIKLPVDDALGRQLVAEVTHTGKKKEAAVQCCLEACRMLEARGLLRQEAVSRKRKKKNWEDEDYYDSDDDTFLDRTGTVEKKRQERMKKAGKIEEQPETFESLLAKLSAVERELLETQNKLNAGKRDPSAPSAEDSLDAFMTAVRSEAALDGLERRKLHVHVADLRRDAQRLRKLVELTRPVQMPSLQPSSSSGAEKPKNSLPLFGAMKGGRKFRLKTGTIGKLPPKRPNLPAELFDLKGFPAGEEEEEDDEGKKEEHEECETAEAASSAHLTEPEERKDSDQSQTQRKDDGGAEGVLQSSRSSQKQDPKAEAEPHPGPKKLKKLIGPSRPPAQLTAEYPQNDPDYSVWLPPAGQTGDGRTHLNDKYGY